MKTIQEKKDSFLQLLRFMGVGIVVGVAYIDPGNWGTDIAAGSFFGYSLLWVVFLSNLMGIVVQYLAAKLGIVTGLTLSEACREYFGKPLRIFLWLTAEVAVIGTDLAEVLGGAIALKLLFNIPLILGAAIISLDVFLILALEKRGYRKLEAVIIGMVAIIGFAYLYEIYLSKPDYSAIVYSIVVPNLSAESVLVASGILGATVMPHAVFLHSSLIKTRVNKNNRSKNLIKLTIADTIIALIMAGLINGAILVMSSAVFHNVGLRIESIEQAHMTLAPLLGGLAAFAFALALLASGLSSSVVATLAGQIIFEGFTKIKMALWKRRLLTRGITIIPAIIFIGLGYDPLFLLVVSQVTLSLQLPFTVIPLIIFTSSKRIMKEHANKSILKIIAISIALFIIALNTLLLYSVLGGKF